MCGPTISKKADESDGEESDSGSEGEQEKRERWPWSSGAPVTRSHSAVPVETAVPRACECLNGQSERSRRLVVGDQKQASSRKSSSVSGWELRFCPACICTQ